MPRPPRLVIRVFRLLACPARALHHTLRRSQAPRLIRRRGWLEGEWHSDTAVGRALAEFFGVAPSRVRVVRGATSRHKIVEIREVS